MNINWGYIAGFVDGEGNIVKNGKNDYRIAIPQTHEGVLKEIQDFSGMGNICKAKKRKPHWKENWVYCIARQKDVLFFLKSIYPYLIVKKGIARKTIPIVAKIVSNQFKNKLCLQKKIKACKFLRGRGLSYRKIGKKLKVDHGYARRLILYK
ncbi:MAG: hypothetical protein HYY86_01090 [Candidatus Harrisonbacteria bacterium]|nr:hypothetical protein [Candidatus Harrisonbacteria bacterium]